MSAHGMTRHVAVPCDDEDGRTWDVWRFGAVVRQRVDSRREAREIDEHQGPSRELLDLPPPRPCDGRR
jgi:hypothetical protein